MMKRFGGVMNQEVIKATFNTSAILTGIFVCMIGVIGWNGREFIRRLQVVEDKLSADREQIVIIKEQMKFISIQLADLNTAQKEIYHNVKYLVRSQSQNEHESSGRRSTGQ